MNIPKLLRFVLGIIRHPSEAGARLRELRRIAAQPPVSKKIERKENVEVSLISVEATDALGEELVDIYVRNPSPYVVGPKTTSDLQRDLDKGFRFFLVKNAAEETVGVRGFDPNLKQAIATVTDFHQRGKGYQVYAGILMRRLLSKEGVDEFRGVVVRSNTRIQRAMLAEGWTLEPHPTKPEMLLAKIKGDPGD